MWLATLSIWGALGIGVIVAWYAYDLPDVEQAMEVDRRPGLTLMSADHKVIASSGDLYGEAVQVKNLPASLLQAVMATEDRRFYDHFGIDVIGIGRAMITNVMAGGIRQGGSTLTQQVAKNLFLTHERSLKRKVQEVLLALWLEQKFTKDQIFTLYLNRVYFGSGTYGVEAAAQKFFEKPARALSLYESAMIAGLLKAPSKYNPRANPEAARDRTGVVLQNMVNAGYLTPAQARTAKAQKDKVIRSVRTHKRGRYFADWVMTQVDDYIGPLKEDLIVTTTLDLGLQAISERRLEPMMANKARQSRATEAALIALAPDGAVRAMIGGRSYRASQFNRATQAKRQPGSAFKPFVYLSALEKGYRPHSTVVDEPIKIGNWQPKNYGHTYRGEITLSEALAQSVNTVAARLGQEVGYKTVAKTAQRLGITSPLSPTPALSLGASEVSLLELTAAYGPFANGGYGVFPYGIEKITTRAGDVLYQRDGAGLGRIIAENHVHDMNRMMSRVISHGTGKKAQSSIPVAGKTGTSQGFRDAWFVGYSKDLVLGIWMGNDNETPMKEVGGSSYPAELFADIMTDAHKGMAPKPLVPKAPAQIADKVENFLGRLFSR